jgi:hypothetical protein
MSNFNKFKTVDGYRINQDDTCYYARECNGETLVEAVRITETTQFSNNAGIQEVWYKAETIKHPPPYQAIYTIKDTSRLYKNHPGRKG